MSYIYDLHVHSCECSGCARATAAEVVHACKASGFSGLALTNHFLTGNNRIPRDIPWEDKIAYYWNAYLDAKKAGEEIDFDVFFGIEHNYGNEQEILLYGIDYDFLAANPDLCEISAEEICERVHAAGGFVSHAHPYRERDYIPKGDFHMDLTYCDAIEIYNSGNRIIDDEKALETCKRLDLAHTAGSDRHCDTVGVYPCGGLEFSYRIRTDAELVAALKRRDGKVFQKGNRA